MRPGRPIRHAWLPASGANQPECLFVDDPARADSDHLDDVARSEMEPSRRSVADGSPAAQPVFMDARSRLVELLGEALEPDPSILEAYLFGSSARGDAAAHSDIDVAVYLAPAVLQEPPPYGHQAEICARLMKALATNRVDVVILNEAPPLLYYRVLRDGIRLFARDLVCTTSREGRALSRYCDYVPQLRKIEAAAKARITSGAFGR
jgi:predicted nucleotidyltransferase